MGAADTAIQYALAQRGKWYSTVPDGVTTFDCSLLVQKAYEAGGVRLPRTTYQQILVGTPVARANLLPGDLIFPSVEHVQLYIGNGQVVEAAHTGTQVRTSNIWGFYAARRVTAPGAVANPGGSTGAGPGGTPVTTIGNPLTDGIAAMVKDALTLAGWAALAGGGVSLMVIGTLVMVAHSELGGDAVRTATRVYTRGLVNPSKTSKAAPAKSSAPPADDQAPDEDAGYQPRHSRGMGRRRRYVVADDQTGERVYAYGRADANKRQAAARAAGRRVRVERA